MKTFPRLLLSIVCALLASNLAAQDATIVPQPFSVRPRGASFTFDTSAVVLVRGDLAAMPGGVRELLELFRAASGCALPLSEMKPVRPEQKVIMLMVEPPRPGPVATDEAYRLDVDMQRIVVRAPSWKGVYYALQSLRQLLPPSVEERKGSATPLKVHCVSIEDQPRFPWRGMHLDVGRHLFPVDFLKKYIDLLAMYKLNVFHWHLTEDQGWRIEIRKYPRITEVGSMRKETMGDGRPYGGFYTQAEVREVVEYARQRGITVVPEIEMPGHCIGALAAYPELSCTGGPFEVGTKWGVLDDVYCAGNDKVFPFIQDVLTEVMALFPSQFIHIGGDECPKTRWKACPKCQARMKAEGLKTEEELQSWFIRRIEKFVNENGRRIIGWDEILEGGLAPNAAVMSWRGIDGGIAAAKAGHDVVMSPTSHCYFDYAQGRSGELTNAGGYIPLERVYGYEPVPDVLTPEQGRHVLGAQGNVWTEWMPDSRIVEYMALPRMAALAEVVWSPKDGRRFDDFTKRMQPMYERLGFLDVNFRVPPPKGLAERMVVFGDTAIALRSQIAGAEIRYELSDKEPIEVSSLYTAPIPANENTTISARLFLPNGKRSPIARASVLHADRARNGVRYEYYEGSWPELPDMNALTPVKSGTVYDMDHLSIRQRQENYALRFRGAIDIPAAGEYTLTTVIDDGGRLAIDGKEIINDDGLHSRHERSATLTLSKGRHPFELRFMQAGGDSALQIWIQGPGMPKQLLPPKMLLPE